MQTIGGPRFNRIEVRKMSINNLIVPIVSSYCSRLHRSARQYLPLADSEYDHAVFPSRGAYSTLGQVSFIVSFRLICVRQLLHFKQTRKQRSDPLHLSQYYQPRSQPGASDTCA